MLLARLALLAALLAVVAPAVVSAQVTPALQTSGVRGEAAPKPAPVPAAPVLDEHDVLTSEADVWLTGRAAGAGSVRVQHPGGTVYVSVTDGRFAALVPLLPDRSHRIVLTGLSLPGVESAATVTEVVRDGQPPRLAVDHPADGALLFADSVHVGGEVLDLLAGSAGVSVTVNGVPATVARGVGGVATFLAPDVPLRGGAPPVPTVLTVVATDALGHVATQQLAVTRLLAVGPTLTATGGDLQTAPASTVLPEPLVARVLLEDEQPLAGKVVEFEVVEGGGRLSPDGGEPLARRLQVLTDEDGHAAAFLHLGARAGAGVHRVRATSVGVAGTPSFVASAVPGPPDRIVLAGGDGQVGAPLGMLPEPLAVWVSDGRNGVPGVPVTFSLLEGQGVLPDGAVATVETDAEGRARVPFRLPPSAGSSRVQADIDGNPGLPVVFTARARAQQPSGASTRLHGFVLDHTGQPLHGATATLLVDGRPRAQALSDAGGRFDLSLHGASGLARLRVDGATAHALAGLPLAAGSHPAHEQDVLLLRGVDNALPAPVFLPRLGAGGRALFDGTGDVVLGAGTVDGLAVLVRAGSLLPGGGLLPSPDEPVLLTLDLAHADELPALPDGAVAPLAFLLGPEGARLDPPAPVTLPNVTGLPPGEVAHLLALDPATDRWQIVATARVAEDGATLATHEAEGLPRTGLVALRVPPPPAARVVGRTDPPAGCPAPAVPLLADVLATLAELLDERFVQLPHGTPREQAAFLADSQLAFACADAALLRWGGALSPVRAGAAPAQQAAVLAYDRLATVLGALQLAPPAEAAVEVLAPQGWWMEAPVPLSVVRAGVHVALAAPAPVLAPGDAVVLAGADGLPDHAVALLRIDTVETPTALAGELLLLLPDPPAPLVLLAGRTQSAPFAGAFELPNVPAADGVPWRTRVLHGGAGSWLPGAAEGFVSPSPGGEHDVGSVPLLPRPGVLALSLAAQDALLEASGQTTLLTALASFAAGGPPTDVSLAAHGTSYASSAPAIAAVDGDGVVTAHGEGRALFSARHDGATATVAVQVDLPEAPTTLTGFVRRGDGSFAAGAELLVLPAGRRVTAGAGGRFELRELPSDEGPLTIVAHADLGSVPLAVVSSGLDPQAGRITDAGFVTLTPAVYWVSDSDGDWNDPLRWSTGLVPGPGDDVVVNRPNGVFTVTKSGGSTARARSLLCRERLVLAGGALTVDLPFSVDADFVLAGGTLRDSRVLPGTGGQGLTVAATSVLDGMVLDCDVEHPLMAQLRVVNGLLLHGTITLAAQGSNLHFNGTQTLSGSGEVVFTSPSTLTFLRPQQGGTLTIGPGITVRGGNGTVGTPTLPLVVQGHVLSDAPGTLLVRGLGWQNAGRIEAHTGTVQPSDTWTSTGTLSASGGTLDLNGTGVVDGPVVTSDGGVVLVGGTLQNAGNVLAITGPGWFLDGGTISGGTIAGSGGHGLTLAANSTLDGVLLDAPLLLDKAGRVTVVNGMQLEDVVTLTAQSATLEFSGTQTLSGSGEIVFDVANFFTNVRGAGGTLTIGPGITIRGNYGTVGSASLPLVFQGHIVSQGPGPLILQGDGLVNDGLVEAGQGLMECFGTWTSHGTLLASGGTLWLNATGPVLGPVQTSNGGLIDVSGVVQNAGRVLTIEGPGWLLNGGTIVGGTVTTTSGDGLTMTANSTLDGVLLDAPLLAAQSGKVTVLNGLQLEDVVELSVLAATLEFSGTQTLSGGGEIVFTSPTVFTNVRGAGGTLTIGPGVTVRGTHGTVGQAGAGLLVEGAIVSDAPGTLVVRGDAWTNAGTLRTAGGDLSASDTWTNAGLVWCGAHDAFSSNAYVQTAAATLRVELAGTAPADHGTLAASGAVTLDGTLEVVLEGGFLPSPGDAFTILTGSPVTGTFATLDLPPGVTWDVSYGPGAVTLTVLP